MGITSSDERTATRLSDLEKRLDAFISQDKPGSQLFTANYIAFGDTNGALTSYAGFIWDNVNKRLGVNTNTPDVTLDVNGPILSADYVRVAGYSTPPSGAGVEIGYVSANGYVTSYDRTAGLFKPLTLRGSPIFINDGVTQVIGVSATGASIVSSTALTASTANNLFLYHRTSGSPATGFGIDFAQILDSATVADRTAFIMRTIWATATDASRKARTTLFALDNVGARPAIVIESSGTAALLGVLGAGAVARQTVTGSRGGNAALASVLTALSNFGFITDSSTA